MVSNREALIKNKVSYFIKTCKLKTHRQSLAYFVKSYEIYLTTKQRLFDERQDFTWHRDLYPVELYNLAN